MNSKTHFPKIKIGVSSCLLGNQVRFDGGHKQSNYLQNTLSRHFDFQTFCPEVAIGMGIPRPPIRLVSSNKTQLEEIKVLSVKDPNQDYTKALHHYSEKVVDKAITNLSGFIFKKDSPSCGMARVKVYGTEGQFVHKKGVGVFAKMIQTHFPELPVEEEGRLNDQGLRENFLMRVYIYHDWQNMIKEGITPKKLVAFHSTQKYLLMAHNQHRARELGQMVAKAGRVDINHLAQNYISLAMELLKAQPNRKRHTNALQHIMGYLSKKIDRQDKQELLNHIMSYRKAEAPLIMPLTLLKHHFLKHPNEYIEKQRYLSPFPMELRR